MHPLVPVLVDAVSVKQFEFDYLDWVAKFHTDTPEKKSKIIVEYIHINALMGYVESAIIDTVHNLGLDREEEGVVLSAFNKLIWIHNDYYAKYYLNPYVNPEEQKKTFSNPIDMCSVITGAIAGALGMWFTYQK